MLQDRNTNVKVDAWIKQFNEEQKVQDQRIANLEETEKTVQNATCFDGCTSAQWKDYIANNPATDIETNNFSVHNSTSEIKMGSNVELNSGSSKVDVDSSSVTNETQFTNQFSEVSKARTEIYSGDDSTHFEAKAECGPEGKTSCIRVSADYSLLHTSTSNTDYGNYYFSNQKAEFTFPNHCFEFCCDGRFLIDGQPSSVTNAICLDGCDGNCWRDYIAAQIPAKAQDTYCFDGCDSDCWRDYIAAQIPSKVQDTYCFDGCDATCWKDYIDSHAGNPSSITSPDGCALVTTICNGNQIYICDPTFTLCTIPDYIPSGPTCVLLLEGRTNCSMCITVCSDDEYNEVCTQINAFSYGERVAELFIGTDQPSGGGGLASIWSTLATVVASRCENSICANCRNIMMSPVNCICARRFSVLTNLQNIIEAIADSNHTGENCLYASTKNTIRSLCNNEIRSGTHCWVFCCDGNLYKDGVCVL